MPAVTNAQMWVPKTAWRNLNPTLVYGQHYLGLHTPGKTKASDTNETKQTKMNQMIAQSLAKMYKAGVPFIDVRDKDESFRFAVPKSYPIHIHDIISTACREILPKNKAEATIVIIGPSSTSSLSRSPDSHARGIDDRIGYRSQRSANAVAALNRMGYYNVITTTYDEISQWFSQQESGAPREK